ncbi:hypothetical protein FRX31_030152 [Thalictrum thalictroides]|uniref:Uncharacterized protein n=1 Tax=Thalictrum thalictroides TaxID=46969 RepID=A0A7J6V5B2_THATH|nr:hypothetical protein FRX31_030152 [Thalictrum thalictroides]
MKKIRQEEKDLSVLQIAPRHANFDVPQLLIRSHAISIATIAAKNVFVSLLVHMEAKRNAHATTIGRHRKESPSAPEEALL